MVRQKSVVLLSGGLDSAANLFFAKYYDEAVIALTADYGQRASQREIASAQALCRIFDVQHEVVELKWLGRLGGSALTGNQAVPILKNTELDEISIISQTAKAVWVPNRNGVLANLAAAYAEKLDCSRIVVGFNSEEAVTFPDNSEEYLRRLNAAFDLSTATKVQAFSYTAKWDKKKIVMELKKLAPEFPFQLIWSCYHGEITPCGSCESCQRLKRALECP